MILFLPPHTVERLSQKHGITHTRSNYTDKKHFIHSEKKQQIDQPIYKKKVEKWGVIKKNGEEAKIFKKKGVETSGTVGGAKKKYR